MNRDEKAQTVEWVGKVFDDNAIVVVFGNKGLTVAEMTDLRSELRSSGASMRVVKNRLVKIALNGRPGEKISDLFQGPTAIAYSADPVAPAKVINKFAKDNENLEILGGAMGPELLDAAGVKALADMPSREEILSSIVGMISSPASNLASAIGAPASNLAAVLETLETREAA